LVRGRPLIIADRRGKIDLDVWLTSMAVAALTGANGRGASAAVAGAALPSAYIRL
jgi:hypothetical protein